MSHSFNPTDTVAELTRYPLLSDDSEIIKAQATPTERVPLVFRHATAGTPPEKLKAK